MQKTRLSVIMSIYNETESQIKEAVYSILNQTFSEFEFIIINDNPCRDEIGDLISQFQDARIQYFVNGNNIGLAMSMNRAVSLANTELFARMDADDVAVLNRLELEYKALLDREVDFVFSNFSYIDEESNLIENDRENSINTSQNDLSKLIALRPDIIHHPTVLFRRSIFERVGGYRNFPCSQDADLWLRMCEAGCRFYMINQILLKYRININGVSSARWLQQQLTCHYIFELSCYRLLWKKDNYSRDNYLRYLEKWGGDQALSSLKIATKNLSLAANYAARGENVMANLKKAEVFFQSRINRRHFLFFLLKKILLNIY